MNTNTNASPHSSVHRADELPPHSNQTAAATGTTDMHRYIELYIYIYVYVLKLHNLFGQIVQSSHFAASSLLFNLRNSFAFKWFHFTSSPGIVYGHNEDSPAAVALVHLANFACKPCLSLSHCWCLSPWEELDLASPWELAQPMGNQREASAIPSRRQLTMHSQWNEFSQFS